MSITVDPGTGLKIFNTRAAKAPVDITGKGYSIVEDEGLKILPAQTPGASFTAEERAKYQEFKEFRRGAADYMPMEGEFSKYLQDVYSAEPVPREALTDECEILVVGAGFAGLLLWHKLREAGFIDVRFCEKGGDVGGTWYCLRVVSAALGRRPRTRKA
jgi:NADPH-dependent 2,4-dienoyl-CoA reductase/sulfur reductase-like enzyme